MGDARIPNIANGSKVASPQSAEEADLQRLSSLLKPFLKSHLSPKAIDRLARDPRLHSFLQDLFAHHRPDEILKIAVISERGQLTIRATLNKEVTQCGVDLSRDGYLAERKCTTSNVVTSELTLNLDRSYVARLNARPPTHVRCQPPPVVAKAPEVVEPPKTETPPIRETPPPPKEAAVDWNSPQSVVDWYDGIYARTARSLRPQPPPAEGHGSVVINRNPPGTTAPGTLMHEVTRKLTPAERLSQDVLREELAAQDQQQDEWTRAEKRGSRGIVLKQKIDPEHFALPKQGMADKMARSIWVDGEKVPPGQMGSSLHRIFMNRSAKWEKLLGRDAKVLPDFEEVQSDFRADRQLVADIVLELSKLIPGPAAQSQIMINGTAVDVPQIIPIATVVAQKLLEGTYAEVNQETASRTIWIHAWLGKMVRHPDLITDKALQDLSPTAREILKFVMRRWSGTQAYSSYWPVFRKIERQHFRALTGEWEPGAISHLSNFPNRYLFVTNWVAEVGRASLDPKAIASQMTLEEYQILNAMIGGGRYSPEGGSDKCRGILAEAGRNLHTEAQNN